ncbi:hypothetical protein DFAR_2690041 [Desulfarculales bacterium]
MLVNVAQVAQVLFKLALNGRDATPLGGGGIILLVDRDAAFAQRNPWAAPGACRV